MLMALMEALFLRGILEAYPDSSQPHWIDSSLLSSRGARVFAEKDILR
jgi:hypothetical protein